MKKSLSDSTITEQSLITGLNNKKNLDIKKELVPKNHLTPNWITGFTDACRAVKVGGCFTVILTKKSTLKWRIIVSFEINLHSKDILILNSIKDFFSFGVWGLLLPELIKIYLFIE